MNYDMFSGKRMDDEDSKYIYPKPYIDPTMYMNPYFMNGMQAPPQQVNQNADMGGYITYMNPFMSNPMLTPNDFNEEGEYVEYPDTEDDSPDFDAIPGAQNIPNPNMFQSMPGMMPNGFMPMMMPPGMMPNIPNGFMPMMMPPGMMFPGMMPNMYMMPGMSPINMEEFDEEEM